jgi:type II secretory pathway pseudopilin PulG
MNQRQSHRRQCHRQIGPRARPPLQHGFTYLGLLILVAIIGVASTASIQLGVVVQRRMAEEALLAIGMEFRNALVSYANATPAGLDRHPASIDDLLKDPRYPGVRRHLRQHYVDPLTGRDEWGITRAPNGGGIVGLYSLAGDKPIKIGNFEAPFQDFAEMTSYRGWVFSGQPTVGQSNLSPTGATIP